MGQASWRSTYGDAISSDILSLYSRLYNSNESFPCDMLLSLIHLLADYGFAPSLGDTFFIYSFCPWAQVSKFETNEVKYLYPGDPWSDPSCSISLTAKQKLKMFSKVLTRICWTEYSKYIWCSFVRSFVCLSTFLSQWLKVLIWPRRVSMLGKL